MKGWARDFQRRVRSLCDTYFSDFRMWSYANLARREKIADFFHSHSNELEDSLKVWYSYYKKILRSFTLLSFRFIIHGHIHLSFYSTLRDVCLVIFSSLCLLKQNDAARIPIPCQRRCPIPKKYLRHITSKIHACTNVKREFAVN